jgi:hypothetical protein
LVNTREQTLKFNKNTLQYRLLLSASCCAAAVLNTKFFRRRVKEQAPVLEFDPNDVFGVFALQISNTLVLIPRFRK